MHHFLAPQLIDVGQNSAFLRPLLALLLSTSRPPVHVSQSWTSLLTKDQNLQPVKTWHKDGTSTWWIEKTGKVLNDSSAFVNTNWFTISDASHFIELEWRAAT